MLSKFKKISKRVYLDHAAATPLDLKVFERMLPFLRGDFGNASALYYEGKRAAEAVAGARKQTSNILNADPSEIIFTAGGTESANLAILGMFGGWQFDAKIKPHIITTNIEHHAVLEPCRELENKGCKVTYLPVDGQGRVVLSEFKKSILPNTRLVSIMYANNEVGTIQPISEISKIIRSHNLARRKRGEAEIVFHIDACQAAGFLDLDVQNLGVDLMTLNASKIYGPKQVGCLYVRKGVFLKPLIYGGGQEKNLRSGTENVAGIVGMAEALQIVQKSRIKEVSRLLKLRDYLIRGIKKTIPNVLFNGSDNSYIKAKNSSFNKYFDYSSNNYFLPNNINLTIPGLEGEMLMLYLDAYGISVATGSACATESSEPSHVLKAIGRSDEECFSSIRITMGKHTNKQQLNYVLKVLTQVVRELRKVKNDNR